MSLLIWPLKCFLIFNYCLFKQHVFFCFNKVLNFNQNLTLYTSGKVHNAKGTKWEKTVTNLSLSLSKYFCYINSVFW